MQQQVLAVQPPPFQAQMPVSEFEKKLLKLAPLPCWLPNTDTFLTTLYQAHLYNTRWYRFANLQTQTPETKYAMLIE